MDDLLDGCKRRVLLVGEGDFSFSVAFAKQILLKNTSGDNLAASITSTSIDSDVTVGKHQHALDNIAMLKDMGVKTVLHIDACQLHTSSLRDQQFDVIIFNFPHIGGKSNIKRNRLLIQDFLISAKSLLSPSGRVYITLCQGQGGTPADSLQRESHDTWQVVAMAANAGFLLTRVSPFRAELFDEYSCTGFRSQDKPFNVNGAMTHIFIQGEEILPNGTFPSIVSDVKTQNDDCVSDLIKNDSVEDTCLSARDGWESEKNLQTTFCRRKTDDATKTVIEKEECLRNYAMENDVFCDKCGENDGKCGKIFESRNHKSYVNNENSAKNKAYSHINDEKSVLTSDFNNVNSHTSVRVCVNCLQSGTETSDVNNVKCHVNTVQNAVDCEIGENHNRTNPYMQVGDVIEFDVSSRKWDIKMNIVKTKDSEIELDQNTSLKTDATRSTNTISDQKVASLYPPVYIHDMSFWVDESPFRVHTFCDVIRNVAGDAVRRVECIDTYQENGRQSLCFRFSYQSLDKVLSYDTSWKLQCKVRLETQRVLGVTLR